MGFWTSSPAESRAQHQGSGEAARDVGRLVGSGQHPPESGQSQQDPKRKGLPLLRDCRTPELVEWLKVEGSNQEFVVKVQERQFDGETLWQYLKRMQQVPFWARLAISTQRWNDLQDAAIRDNAIHKQRQKEDMRYIKETLSFIRKMMDQYN
ncbi:hypothetical protein KFL_000270170 [Klebsormidium nitens]|uniref:Uncharacterized protein n=1 Tax=Klebsormidium nitens TaxID=105231 RepID=A0A1Y1HTU4_KLENI|nr:hypothetical protein KFL_000270170 [Klebsormidium nitens]|eukprot:GAQ79258.1 hypothetical protein KFL_000270170 [Klebsormidium nitens]